MLLRQVAFPVIGLYSVARMLNFNQLVPAVSFFIVGDQRCWRVLRYHLSRDLSRHVNEKNTLSGGRF